jgi:hypothetical protein
MILVYSSDTNAHILNTGRRLADRLFGGMPTAKAFYGKYCTVNPICTAFHIHVYSRLEASFADAS